MCKCGTNINSFEQKYRASEVFYIFTQWKLGIKLLLHINGYIMLAYLPTEKLEKEYDTAAYKESSL